LQVNATHNFCFFKYPAVTQLFGVFKAGGDMHMVVVLAPAATLASLENK
jgi:hypothetical protein